MKVPTIIKTETDEKYGEVVFSNGKKVVRVKDKDGVLIIFVHRIFNGKELIPTTWDTGTHYVGP